MSEEMVGIAEAYQRGCESGYQEALCDIQKEINQIRYNFQSLSIPIIEGLITKLESTKTNNINLKEQQNERTRNR